MIIKNFLNKKFRENRRLTLMSFAILFMGTPDFAVPILEAINNQIIKF